MATYTIDAENQETESLLVAYQERRSEVQSIAGQMYLQIERAERAYTSFEAQMGAEYEPLTEYHDAKQAPVSEAVALLRAKMAEVAELMEQMQAAMPAGITLFPGVPGAVVEEEALPGP
jgi:hypothetical protein